MLDLWYRGTTILRTSGAIYPTTERNIQEDLNLQHRRWKNFKSRKNISTSLTSLFENCIFVDINFRARCLWVELFANFCLYSAVILNSLKDIAKLFSHWFKRVPYWSDGPCNCDALNNEFIICGHAKLGVSLKASENNYYYLSAS